VSLNARYGFTRFEKRSGGAFQTLAVNARGYIENQAMTISAEINGTAIVVWIDGDPTFAHVDSSPLSGTVALYCQDSAQFDNVVITENPLQPVVAIASPLAYSIASTRNNGSVLSTRSVLLNMPAGGDLVLSLDGNQIVANPVGNVYTRNFFGVAAGEHEFATTIRYANGEQANADINSTVGTGGDYYVSTGDSITNGVGDNNPSNNDSIDGRIVANQGFQAPLADSLWTASRPVIVFNEGIPGDQSSDLASRIDSILERHPLANGVLLLIGTNDSGVGVSPGDFYTNVSNTAASIVVDGKQVWLAEILPTRDEPLRNALIEQYNSEIQAIAATGGDDIFPGPDFYEAFTNSSNVPISAYYTNNLHPNDTGYGVMVSRWINNLP
jgi:lysophospholipase L1-like esterase